MYNVLFYVAKFCSLNPTCKCKMTVDIMMKWVHVSAILCLKCFPLLPVGITTGTTGLGAEKAFPYHCVVQGGICALLVICHVITLIYCNEFCSQHGWVELSLCTLLCVSLFLTVCFTEHN